MRKRSQKHKAEKKQSATSLKRKQSTRGKTAGREPLRSLTAKRGGGHPRPTSRSPRRKETSVRKRSTSPRPRPRARARAPTQARARSPSRSPSRSPKRKRKRADRRSPSPHPRMPPRREKKGRARIRSPSPSPRPRWRWTRDREDRPRFRASEIRSLIRKLYDTSDDFADYGYRRGITYGPSHTHRGRCRLARHIAEILAQRDSRDATAEDVRNVLDLIPPSALNTITNNGGGWVLNGQPHNVPHNRLQPPPVRTVQIQTHNPAPSPSGPRPAPVAAAAAQARAQNPAPDRKLPFMTNGRYSWG